MRQVVIYPGEDGYFVSDSFQTMLASEPALREDWERPEEQSAWADL